MNEMVTIKVESEARDALQKISVQTGEKQYAVVARLALQEKRRLATLERASRFPANGQWEVRFRKPKTRKGK